MAVPVFGPIDLDEVAARRVRRHRAAAAPSVRHPARAPAPVKVLIITGDTVSAHDWKETTAEADQEFSRPAARPRSP